MGSQKVVIPKGLVNPNETTIVEIPKNLQNVGTVVARPRDASSSCSNPECPSAAKMPTKKSYMRRTLPRATPLTYGRLHEGGTTFAGRPYEEESSTEESPYKFKMQYPTAPGNRYGEISTGDISYGAGRKHGFDPPADPALSSTFQDMDYREGTLYRDFRPKLASSRPSSPARTPGSMKRWQSTAGTVSPGTSYEPSGEFTDESYGYGDSSGPINESSGCPCSDGSSGAYQRFDSSGGSGGYQRFDSPESSGGSGGYQRFDSSDSSGGLQRPGSPQRKITQREVMNSLGDLEAVELNQIMGDLNMFQNARRRLVFDASTLASAADVSSSLLSSSG